MKNLWENVPRDADASWFTKTASIYDGSLEKVDQRLQQKVMSSYDMFGTHFYSSSLNPRRPTHSDRRTPLCVG
jgi:hypothetical protein